MAKNYMTHKGFLADFRKLNRERKMAVYDRTAAFIEEEIMMMTSKCEDFLDAYYDVVDCPENVDVTYYRRCLGVRFRGLVVEWDHYAPQRFYALMDAICGLME